VRVSYDWSGKVTNLTYLIETTNLARAINKCLATVQTSVFFLLKWLEIDHTLNYFPVAIDETPD
jgi:hypothetical protein